MFILDLSIDGNPILDADPNCMLDEKKMIAFANEKQWFLDCLDRQHILDCLPRVWMCDGVFISSQLIIVP